MKNEAEVLEAVKNLPRYEGTKFTNGPSSWSMAFCRRMDSLGELSNDVALDVLELGLYDDVPTSSLKRGDLIIRRWADGRYSIDVVVSVTEHGPDSLGNNSGGWDVLTTNSGGNFRTVSQMWTTSPTESLVRTEARSTEAHSTEDLSGVNFDDLIDASDDLDDAFARALAYTDDVGLSDGTDRPAETVAELDDVNFDELVDSIESELCQHEGPRTSRSFFRAFASPGFELVCQECGSSFGEIELVDRDRLVPGDLIVENDSDGRPPYWQVERVVGGFYDAERKIFLFRDSIDGIVERKVVTAPACYLAGVFARNHERKVDDARRRNARILDGLAMTVFRGTHYFDGSGEIELDSLVRDFRSGGGTLLDEDSIVDAIEGRVVRLRTEMMSRAREIYAEIVHSAVLEAAPIGWSANWADALTKVVDAALSSTPTTRVIGQARDEILDGPILRSKRAVSS